MFILRETTERRGLQLANTGSPIELLVTLGVNDAPSKDNINSYIEKLSKTLKEVNLEFDVKGQLKQELKSVQEGLKETQKQAVDTGKKIQDSFTFKGNMKEARKAAKKMLEEQNREYFNNFNELEKKLQAKGFKIKLEINPDTGKAEKAIATLQKSANEALKVTYKPFDIYAKDTNKLGQGVASTKIETSNTSTHKLEEGLKRAKRELDEIAHRGKLTEDQLRRLREALPKVQDSEGLAKYNREVQESLDLTRRQRELHDATTEVIKQRDKALNQLTRSENLFRKTFNTERGNEVRKGLEDIPIEFSNMREIKEAQGRISQLRTQIQGLNADATEATKNSMGVVEAFKIAMERFPIWMAASTAFYGTVRAIRSAVQQIVDIDSQLTVLKRVAGDGIEVNEVLEESIKLAQQLGNQIQDINEGFIAFARQGFRGDELNMMTEYATLLGNISDMSVDDAASTLTAALKGFNMEAQEGIHVVDALNEVDNNYAITTGQLAQAIMRSAGAAHTYGKLNAA